MEKELTEAIETNWEEHVSEEFIKSRDKYEQDQLRELKEKGFEKFKKYCIEMAIGRIEDNDIFWEFLEGWFDDLSVCKAQECVYFLKGCSNKDDDKTMCRDFRRSFKNEYTR